MYHFKICRFENVSSNPHPPKLTLSLSQLSLALSLTHSDTHTNMSTHMDMYTYTYIEYFRFGFQTSLFSVSSWIAFDYIESHSHTDKHYNNNNKTHLFVTLREYKTNYSKHNKQKKT